MTSPAMSERRLSLVGATMIALGPLSVAIYTPALPDIVRDLGTTENAVNLTITVFYAGLAAGQLICGVLSDGLGRRRVALGFFTLYVAASLLALLASSIEVLVAARLLQGLGAAAGVVISRALVRDLFTGQASSRILNMMAIIIAAGPAAAPALGSLVLLAGNYHLLFAAMVIHGVLTLGLVLCFVVETLPVDLSRLRPLAMAQSMAALLVSRSFLLPALCTAGCAGAIYGQASVLPFILITRLGLSPLEFGLGMFLQSGVYMLGSLWTRQLLRHHAAPALVPVGCVLALVGALALFIGLVFFEPTFWSVMGPVALYAFGYAHAAPAVMTAAFHAHPQRAGAASALHGFMQIVTGFAIGAAAALLGDPVLAMGVMVAGSTAIGALAGLVWFRLDRPRLA